MITLDTETVGFCGPIVLFQYVIGDGEIVLVDLWKKKIQEIIDLLEMIVNHEKGIVGFNLAYDFFHIYQMWTVLQLMENKQAILEDCIQEYAFKEEQGRYCKLCMKPQHCFDVMLHARKTRYQSTMDRSDIKIRKVPVILAQRLADELNKRIRLSSIYFARRKKDRDIPWKVYSCKDPQFCDVVLKFAASSGLKALAIDALGLDPDETLYYTEAGVPEYLMPFELGYAPFYGAIPKSKQHLAWPSLIRQHINHWQHNEKAREYARKDVENTRALYQYFNKLHYGDSIGNTNNVLMDDDDSVLACLVAVVRWKGFRVDLESVRNLRDRLRGIVEPDRVLQIIGLNPDHVPTAPKQVKEYIAKGFNQDPIGQAERSMFLSKESTNKIALQSLVKDYKDHEVSRRASKVLEARDAKYQINFLEKLLRTGRLHPDLHVIGTLSSRMSGKGKLNVTGVKRTKEVRQCFTLANEDEILCGGDFESFEVALAAAKYKDPNLTKDLMLCWKCKYEYKANEILLKKCPSCGLKDSRQKIHALFAMELFPGNTYEQILASKGTNNDMYSLGKNGVFSMIYGGDWNTLKIKYGIPQEVAERAEAGFMRRYPNIRIAREQTKRRFQSMIQPAGIGTKVIWREPDEYIESLLGFRRYFTLENMICKTLFQIANDPPSSWRDLKIPIMRRDRIQMVGGAVQSALFAAAFNIQSSAMRAAENHTIQSTGSQINKRLQTKIWGLQPKGIYEWVVTPLNIHDELMIPTKPEYVSKIKQIVDNVVESYRKLVPLIAFDFKSNMRNWSEK